MIRVVGAHRQRTSSVYARLVYQGVYRNRRSRICSNRIPWNPSYWCICCVRSDSGGCRLWNRMGCQKGNCGIWMQGELELLECWVPPYPTLTLNPIWVTSNRATFFIGPLRRFYFCLGALYNAKLMAEHAGARCPS